MFRLHVWPDVGLVICKHSWYTTTCQVALTVGFRVPTCSRTNTDSALYLFLTCTRPPDFDTDRVTKTRITWQLQSNEEILFRPHLRIVSFRAFEQDLSRTSNNNYFVRRVSTGVIDISPPNYNSYVRECVCRDLSVSCRASFDSQSIFLTVGT
jgi:hypothetical protein